MGKLCIVVEPRNKVAVISEELCNGCNICTKQCPFGAISIVNIPANITRDVTHRYGENAFKLHRLPVMKRGNIMGIIGANGIGKSTAIKIIAGKIKPNMGDYNNPPDWQGIINRFKGGELHSYFIGLVENKTKTVIKPQYVDQIPKAINGKVRDHISESSAILCDLIRLYTRDISALSGGELQRFAIAKTIDMATSANVIIFDEMTSYLDIKQRVDIAAIIRKLSRDDNYIIAIEHDLAILDYLSDNISCVYGESGAYGIITAPYNTREGINIYLDGYIPTENMRFREESFTFYTPAEDFDITYNKLAEYSDAIIKYGSDFELKVDGGTINSGEIILLLGENGCGKSTYLQHIYNSIGADIHISVKSQKLIIQNMNILVSDYLYKYGGNYYLDREFMATIVKPMGVDKLFDRVLDELSGGELQRVSIVCCLVNNSALLYLIDEPSAFLDCEQRIAVSRAIKRWIKNTGKAAIIVEHDFLMACYLADRVITYNGEPGKSCIAEMPQPAIAGINKFLKSVNITYRMDKDNYRPRINKPDSVKDKEQKRTGNYYQ
jgi:ATP-binding cassette subfamily E protein 1